MGDTLLDPPPTGHPWAMRSRHGALLELGWAPVHWTPACAYALGMQLEHLEGRAEA